MELIIAKLEPTLLKKRIRVEEKPTYFEKYSINETALEGLIESKIPTQNPTARAHDVDCLSAIHRLRLGRKMDYLESCVAIFITTNSAIASTAMEFFHPSTGVQTYLFAWETKYLQHWFG